MPPRELWAVLGVSRQGAKDLITPLLEAGLLERAGRPEERALCLEEPLSVV